MSANKKVINKNNNKYILITIVLIISNFICAVGVIYTRHINRTNLIELNNLVQEHDSLYQEWTQLVLEQSTLKSYNRIDRLARNNLNMREPKWSETRIITLDIDKLDMNKLDIEK